MATPVTTHTLSSGKRRIGLNEYTSNAFFYPSDLPGLYAWLKPDDSPFYQDAARATPCTNNTLCYAWNDSSGNGIHFDMPTSLYRPTYYTNIINGYPALLFANSGTPLMRLSSSTFASLGQPISVAIVAQPLDTLNGSLAYVSLFNGQSNAIQVTWAKGDAATSPPWMYAGTGGPRFFWQAWSFTSFNYAVMSFNGANSLGRANGSGSKCESTPGATGCGTHMQLGGGVQSSGVAMHAYIAEFIMWTVALSVEQMAQVEAYFRWKYALP